MHLKITRQQKDHKKILYSTTISSIKFLLFYFSWLTITVKAAHRSWNCLKNFHHHPIILWFAVCFLLRQSLSLSKVIAHFCGAKKRWGKKYVIGFLLHFLFCQFSQKMKEQRKIKSHENASLIFDILLDKVENL